jgi:hypothetical protein
MADRRSSSMDRALPRILTALFLLASAAAPAVAELQYFGYVGGANDDNALARTRSYSNFAHLSARPDVEDPFVRVRVLALSQRGMKAVIDLDRVFWCDPDGDHSYRDPCKDWASRWKRWKAFNAGVLTPDRVLAFGLLDEPFNQDADMDHYEAVAAQVKADLPWARLYMVEGACVIVDGKCGSNPVSHAFANYHGSLPGIDWIGVDDYGIHPATDATFQEAVRRMRARFPDKQWLYVMDGWWASYLHPYVFGKPSVMGRIAREWYDVARADPDAVLLGVFLWEGSRNLPCNVLLEHAAIGRAVTGKQGGRDPQCRPRGN